MPDLCQEVYSLSTQPDRQLLWTEQLTGGLCAEASQQQLRPGWKKQVDCRYTPLKVLAYTCFSWDAMNGLQTLLHTTCI